MTRTKFTVRTETANAETITDFEARALTDGRVEIIVDQSTLKTLGKRWHREVTCVTLTADQFAAVRALA